MGTLTAGFLIMRWGLLSAVIMFLASTVKIKCRQNSHYFFSFVCSSIGIVMSCWFVTGLMGITLSMQQWHLFISSAQEAFINVVEMTPDSWPDY